MNKKILTASLLILALSQTACLTTVHTRPFHHNHQHQGHHHVAKVPHPRPVFVPAPRHRHHHHQPTVVTVRRY